MSISLAEVRASIKSALKKTTKAKLEEVFKKAKSGIRVKTYYSVCWEYDCYCRHPFMCALLCADDFYGDSRVEIEAY